MYYLNNKNTKKKKNLTKKNMYQYVCMYVCMWPLWTAGILLEGDQDAPLVFWLKL